MKKTFVTVDATFDENGEITPKTIYWEDGRHFDIDKIIDKKNAVSMKVGGIGIRYTCKIAGKQTYLFFENPRWFVEER